MSSWFSGISELATSALSAVDNFTDNIVAQATAAEGEILAEQKKAQEEQREREIQCTENCLLPWESPDETLSILSQDLMEQIFALSFHEENFTETSANANTVEFSFKKYIPAIMKMLALDSNLARVHAKLSPKMDEETFWFNFHCRVSYLRAIVGIDGETAKAKAQIWNRDDIIHTLHNTKTLTVEQEAANREHESTLDAIGVVHRKDSGTLTSDQKDANDSALLDKAVEAALERYLDGDDDSDGGVGGAADDDEDLDNLDFLDELDLRDLDGENDDDVDDAALEAALDAEDVRDIALSPHGSTGDNQTTPGSSYVNLDSNQNLSDM